MNKKKAASALTAFALLCGCQTGARQPAPSPQPSVASASAMKGRPDEYSLFFEADCPLGLYEPETGCYLGAYVLSNRQINFDINKFDEMAGKSHAISVYNLKAGSPFPDNWLISCVADNKTPYFVLTPPNGYNPYDRSIIDEAAEGFGKFYVPMFVEFYPVSGLAQDSKEYVEFFRYARKVFKEKASNAAFVWAVDGTCAVGSEAYYPGGMYTDWVGLHFTEPLIDDGYGSDIFNALDYFYYTYQKTKPIAVSRLAVSHYTSADYIYKNYAASDEISRVYGRIANDYPRVKMVAYMDYDEPMPDPQKRADCYTVTENDIVLAAYGKAVSDGRFKGSTAPDKANGAAKTVQLMKSPFPALKIGEYWYAPEHAFTYDLQTKGALGERLIDGDRYYNINMFAKNAHMELTADDAGRRVVLGLGGNK